MAGNRRDEHKDYRERNREAVAERQRAWRAAHPGYGKKWYAENKHRWSGYRATQRAKSCAPPQS